MNPHLLLQRGGVRIGPLPERMERPVTRVDGLTYFPDASPSRRVECLAEAIRAYVRQHRVAPYSKSDATRLQNVEHIAADLEVLIPHLPDTRVAPESNLWKKGAAVPEFDYQQELWECLCILTSGELFDIDRERSSRALKDGALDKLWNIAEVLDRLAQEFGAKPSPAITTGSHLPAHAPPIPLTEGQKKIWDALDGRCLSAKELVLVHAASSEEVARAAVRAMRKAGHTIERRASRGYYRPDAPPPPDATH